MPQSRKIRLLRTSGNQVICIPEDFELPGSEAIISRDGDRFIIEPVYTNGLAALLDNWELLDETFPEIEDPPPASKSIF